MKIRNLFKKKELTPHVIEEVFTYAGHEFRVLDPVSMPKVRSNALVMGDYDFRWSMEKEDIIAYDDMVLKEAAFPKSWSSKDDLIAQMEEKLRDISALIDMRKTVLSADYNVKPFLKAASHIVLIDDEKPEALTGKHYDLKMELCQRHPEVEAFFLRIGKAFCLKMSGSLDISKLWESYPAKATVVMESKVLSKIGKRIY